MARTRGIQLVVFDWAGTTVDHGCMAPVAAFLEVFQRHGITPTLEQARAPMGLHKRDHIQAMLQMPAIAQAWKQVHGRESSENDVQALYDEFVPLQLEAVEPHNTLVPGLLECLRFLQTQRIHIAGTTGYYRAAHERALASARQQGYSPEVSICAEDVSVGRPAPWMIFRCMEAVGVYPPLSVVKVGDTVVDIQAGIYAGAWSVGVTQTSSEVGLSAAEWNALPHSEQESKLTAARNKFQGAGAHAVLQTLAELPGLIERLNERLQLGEKP